MLTVLLPVIRDWTRESVIAAIAASDIPREDLILVLDAPDCWEWASDLTGIGFHVVLVVTGGEYPPEGRIERRGRHRAMVKFTQSLVPDGPLLCLEDDILVPTDIYARLTAIGPHATGIQIARHEKRIPVLYPLQSMGAGIAEVQGCGFGCLLTTGEAYRTPVGDGPGPVDRELTSRLRPLRVDFGCVCGHMTREGVLYP